jgi:hypothetical protein
MIAEVEGPPQEMQAFAAPRTDAPDIEMDSTADAPVSIMQPEDASITIPEAEESCSGSDSGSDEEDLSWSDSESERGEDYSDEDKVTAMDEIRNL